MSDSYRFTQATSLFTAVSIVLTGCLTTTPKTQPVSRASESATHPKPPNIVLVMTDDQGYGDLGCHGHPFLKTPHLDTLHAQSTRFTDFHASPTCSPTRAALMTGRGPFKNGVTHTILERERLTLEATTIAEVLGRAGYTTGIFGKWHLGDADEYQPGARGFDEVFIHGAGGIGQDYPGTVADVPDNGYFDPIIKHNGRFVKTKGYCTDVFFKQALKWIKDAKDKDKPFFAYISTNAPHYPYIVADKYKKPFMDKASEHSAAFFGMVVNIDENMGGLMHKLDAWELANNTLLVFMTDNGTSAGTFNYGMKGRKNTVNEGGTRVPLFVRLPGRTPPGVDVDRLTRHFDLFPTLVEIAGAKAPDGVNLDGRSLWPLIDHPDAKWKDRFTFFHKGRWGKEGGTDRYSLMSSPDPEDSKYRDFAVRSERWRLVENALYDIEADPGETTDVASKHPEVVAEMRAAYDNWWSEIRPLLVNEDASLNTPKPFRDQYEAQKRSTGIPEWEEPEL